MVSAALRKLRVSRAERPLLEDFALEDGPRLHDWRNGGLFNVGKGFGCSADNLVQGADGVNFCMGAAV